MRETPFFRGRAGGGQLLLMRAAGWGKEPEKRRARDADDEEGDEPGAEGSKK
jgi:hypothetical protein